MEIASVMDVNVQPPIPICKVVERDLQIQLYLEPRSSGLKNRIKIRNIRRIRTGTFESVHLNPSLVKIRYSNFEIQERILI